MPYTECITGTDMIEYDIPYIDVINKRKFQKFLDSEWLILSDCDRAIHILEESDLYMQALDAQEFLKLYEQKYISKTFLTIKLNLGSGNLISDLF